MADDDKKPKLPPEEEERKQVMVSTAKALEALLKGSAATKSWSILELQHLTTTHILTLKEQGLSPDVAFHQSGSDAFKVATVESVAALAGAWLKYNHLSQRITDQEAYSVITHTTEAFRVMNLMPFTVIPTTNPSADLKSARLTAATELAVVWMQNHHWPAPPGAGDMQQVTAQAAAAFQVRGL